MNPFYKNHQQNQIQRPQNIQDAMQNLLKQIAPTGMTPEQIVRQKIQNGEITQAQFERYSMMANQVLGKK